MSRKKIVCTVINDLTYDQRMQRICNSLQKAGYDVLLVGRKQKNISAPQPQSFAQKRLSIGFSKGFMLYAAYNVRLFFFLLFTRMDAVYAVDLDTILPCYFISKLRRKKRLYDAHELFTELKEIVTRPAVHKFWLGVERFALPKFPYGYSVNEFIVKELNRRYGVQYEVIRNLPTYTETDTAEISEEKFIIYQGAVNEGRSFETLIPAMQYVNAKLIVCGKGNFFEQAVALVKQYQLENKVEMRGYVLPSDLKKLTPKAYVAVTVFEATGLNQYYSLSNRFFDYIMAQVPQLCVNFPEYKAINDQFQIAHMIDDTSVQAIADGLNTLLNNAALHHQLKQNCIKARKVLCWEQEEKKLISYWNRIMN